MELLNQRVEYLSQTLKHVVTLLFRTVTIYMECFYLKTLPGTEQELLGLERTTSGKIWMRISCFVKQTDFRFLSPSVFIHLLFSCSNCRNNAGKIPDCLHGAQGRQQRHFCAYLGQSCQEEGVSCQGSGPLMAGGDHMRPSRERWHSGEEWRFDLERNLRGSRFCFRECWISWCSLKQHTCCLRRTLS